MASSILLRQGANPSRPTSNVNPPAKTPRRSIQLEPLQPAVGFTVPDHFLAVEPRPLSAFDDDPVVTTAGAARILGISVTQLKKWRQRSKGPSYFQYGKRGPVRYRLSDLRSFQEKNLVTTNPANGDSK